MKRPGVMENPGTIELASLSRIETVPLDEEEIQRTRPGFSDSLADHPGSFELGRGHPTACTPRSKVDGPILMLEAHASVEVGQVEGQPGSQNGDCVIRIQREKPHPWHTVEVYVRPDVQLVGLAQVRQDRRKYRPYAPHGERGNADPGDAIVSVYG